MKLEEILFGLIGTGGCWRVFLKTEDGEGCIYIRNGVIVRVKYKDLFGEFEGEEALKVIVENSAVVESVDLQPCSQKVEQNVEYDFSKLMLFFEKFKLEKDALNALSEVESNIQDVYEKIIIDSEKFKELLKVCENVFSEGSISAIFLLDKNGILKIEGDVRDIDMDFKAEFSVFVDSVKSVCSDSEYVEFISNISNKFIYGIYSLKLEAALIAIFDVRERANFELDQDVIREAFKNTLKKL